MGTDGYRNELINEARELSPVMIWAPTARCGVTLLQRLITSTRDVLVYGENMVFSNALPSIISEVAGMVDASKAARQRLVDGDYNFWASNVMPDTDFLLPGMMRAFYEICLAYQQSTIADGFDRFGIKSPNANPSTGYPIVSRLLPRSQHVFMYRNIESVLSSYKSRKWLDGPAAASKIAEDWAQATRKIVNIQSTANTLVVRYETLMESPQFECQRIQTFLGTKPFDMQVLGYKVNTFMGEESQGRSASEYIPPTLLTDDERCAMLESAGETMAELGYN